MCNCDSREFFVQTRVCWEDLMYSHRPMLNPEIPLKNEVRRRKAYKELSCKSMESEQLRTYIEVSSGKLSGLTI